MSGHSHFSSIKHKKAITDAKRGKIFSKLARQISIAAKEKGGNPETNPALRLAIERAKSFNLPKENIERAIKKGIGKTEEAKLEKVIYEAYGPGGIAIIIEGITDNTNRTLNEIKQILNQNNGKLAGEGSVKWLFERKGIITIDPGHQAPNIKTKEEIELLAIEAGAEDIYPSNHYLDIYTKPEKTEEVKKILEEKGIKIESATLGWKTKNLIQVNEKDKQNAQKLFEELDENDAVQEIYSNIQT